MRRLPPLNALRAFEAAARLGSFRRAADELHVTPTAISHQVRHLEERLGCALFRRQPRPVRLTTDGQRLFPELRAALDRIGLAVAALQSPQAAGPLVVTTTGAFASRWLMPRLAALQGESKLPRLAINASEAVVDLHRGDADFAIRYSRTPPAELESSLLFSDEYAVVGHPTLVGRECDLDELKQFPLIHFTWKADDPEAPTWHRWLAHARLADPNAVLPDPDSGIHVSEETLAIEAALRGQGLALVSNRIVSAELRNGSLVQPVDLTLGGLSFFAVYNPDHPRIHDIRRALSLIKNSDAS